MNEGLRNDIRLFSYSTVFLGFTLAVLGWYIRSPSFIADGDIATTLNFLGWTFIQAGGAVGTIGGALASLANRLDSSDESK